MNADGEETGTLMDRIRRTIWHTVRAAIMFLGLRDYPHPSFSLASLLVFAGTYDVVLACFRKISPITRQTIALMVLPTALVLMMLEHSPWDNCAGYAALLLYLPELVINVRPWKQRVAVLSCVVVVSFVAAFFSLYRLGWVATYPNARIDGEHVSCRTVKVIGTPDTIVIANEYWILLDKYWDPPLFSSANRSLVWNHIAFVDVRYLNAGELGFDDEGRCVVWYPKVTYENRRLSFYILRGKLFVCDGVNL